jgi:hypothetical protein
MSRCKGATCRVWDSSVTESTDFDKMQIFGLREFQETDLYIKGPLMWVIVVLILLDYCLCTRKGASRMVADPATLFGRNPLANSSPSNGEVA